MDLGNCASSVPAMPNMHDRRPYGGHVTEGHFHSDTYRLKPHMQYFQLIFQVLVPKSRLGQSTVKESKQTQTVKRAMSVICLWLIDLLVMVVTDTHSKNS